jgi:hypothetical protein
MKLCIKIEVPGQYEVTLEQSKQGWFLVKYGKQVAPFLDYSEAATELGTCIMHAVACNGDLNNDL